MSKTNKIVAWIVVIVIVVLAVSAVSKKQKTELSGEPIKIGVVYALTGIASSWTEFGRNAANMAAEEINSSGGVNGRPIELIYEDSQTNPAKSVSAFQKLVTIDKVDAIIGDVWAFITNPLIPLSTQNKIVVISPTVMDASVEKPGGDYFFTLGHTMGGIENSVRNFFDLNPQAKTAGLICWGVDAWGLAFTDVYERIAKEKGVEIIVKTCTTDFSPNYRNEAAKIKAAKPDVVLVNGVGGLAVNSLRTFGVMTPIIADSNTIDGFENQGSVSLEQLKDVYVIDWHPNKKFADSFQNKYGAYPILESQNSYEAVRSIAEALKNNPKDILAGLKEVKYTSVEGVIDFTTGTNINPNKTEAKLYKVIGKGNYEEIK